MAGKQKAFSAYRAFREYFRNQPELLKERDNSKVVDMFKRDYPKVPWDIRAQQALANAKNYERKGAKKRKKQMAKVQRALSTPQVLSGAKSQLNVLEDRIDDCLAMAKEIDRDGLHSIVKHLHRARNDLVMIIEG